MKKVRTPRKRWHDEHALEKVKEHFKDKMLVSMSRGKEYEDLSTTKIKKLFKGAISVTVIRECDLRATLEEKALSCNEYTDWTAFVNRAGTLVHIVPKEGDFHTRHPLYFSTRKMSDKAIERMVQQITLGRLR